MTAIPVSTAPSVKAYLFAGIQAALSSQKKVLVCYGEPGPNLPPDVVSIGDVPTRTTEQAAMVGSGGAGWLDERYSVEVVVDTYRGLDRAQEAEERAWALLAVVETFVRTDPSLGDRVIESRPGEARSESGWEDGHKGRRTRLTVAVDVYARI